MKNFIKTISLVLAIYVALIMLASCDKEKENTEKVYEDENFIYEMKDGNAVVYSYKGKGENVKIPSTFDGKPVTKIDESAFELCDFIKSIEIPDSVTTIGMFAFHGCTALESVKLSNSLTYIQESVFADCVSLKSISIPSGVISIGDGAFSGCQKLESVEIPQSVQSISYGAFLQCYSLKSITIPEGVTSIEDNTFAYCKSLESIKIPKGVKNIGYGAFEGCVLIKEVVIPKATTSLWNNAFSGCSALENIYCEATEKPEYWDDGWNADCSAKVYFGDAWTLIDGKPTIK